VPKLPPILPLPYEHVNTQYELNPLPNQISSSIPCMHHLTTYLFLMAQLAQIGGVSARRRLRLDRRCGTHLKHGSVAAPEWFGRVDESETEPTLPRRRCC